VRRCAIKNIGDTFALKMNMTRQIEEPILDEEDYVMGIERIYDEKANVIKFEKNQFGPPEEEEEGEKEEDSEGEQESEGEAEESEGEAEAEEKEATDSSADHPGLEETSSENPEENE